MSFRWTKTTFPIINGINNINILYTGSHKRIPKYYGQWVKNLKSLFQYVCMELNKMKLTWVFLKYKNMFAIKIVLLVLNFHIQGLTKVCGYMIFYSYKYWKSIFNWVKRFLFFFTLLYYIYVLSVIRMKIDRVSQKSGIHSILLHSIYMHASQ